ncbi:hypothetical protein P7K49_020397 [Saguinus oedipus]|uniref:Uncharacterized protein n=1 Tax=Saguinus oedipus TaxID=9490 RepID=A0ABQ9V0T9_SAGOE|nr:hypothetical protein P7K49_020397 [Saguinus oedipus]
MRVTSRKPSRRGSTLSLNRTSGGSSPQSSMVSVNPGSDEPPSVNTQATSSKDIEDNESSSTKPDEEALHMTLLLNKKSRERAQLQGPASAPELAHGSPRDKQNTGAGGRRDIDKSRLIPSLSCLLKPPQIDSEFMSPILRDTLFDQNSGVFSHQETTSHCDISAPWTATNTPEKAVPKLMFSLAAKLLEMVREDARRTITIENGMQRKAPRCQRATSSNFHKVFKDKTSLEPALKKKRAIYRRKGTSLGSIPQALLICVHSRTNYDINIQYKSGVCNTMRARFYSVAQEAGFCLQDKMEILMK